MIVCSRERHRRWAAAHPYRVKEQRLAVYYRDLEWSRARKREAQRRYKARHPDRVKMSQRTYAEMLRRAGGRPPRPRCAFCGGRFYQREPGPRACTSDVCRALLRALEALGTIGDAARPVREYLPPSDGWSFLKKSAGKPPEARG